MVSRKSASLCSKIGHLRQRNKMILDVLASGEVPLAAAEFVGNRRQLIHLRRGHRSARDLGADHVDAGLALAVNAAPQPLGAELVVASDRPP